MEPVYAVKPVLSGRSKTTNNRLMQVKSIQHSAILLNCIKLPHGFKTFALSIFEWPLKTGFTVGTFGQQCKWFQ